MANIQQKPHNSNSLDLIKLQIDIKLAEWHVSFAEDVIKLGHTQLAKTALNFADSIVKRGRKTIEKYSN